MSKQSANSVSKDRLSQMSQQMYPLIASYESGERSRREICESASISEAKFSYWLTKYRHHLKAASPQKSNFIELKPDKADRATSSSMLFSDIEITYPDEVRLKINETINLATLKALLNLKEAY